MSGRSIKRDVSRCVRNDGANSNRLPPGKIPPGVWAPCKVVKLLEGTTDILTVQLPGCEIDVVMIDCVGPPMFVGQPTVQGIDDRPVNSQAVDAIRRLWELIDRAKNPVLHLPQPPADRGFFKSIRPGSMHPGRIYLPGDRRSINEILVSEGWYESDASRAA